MPTIDTIAPQTKSSSATDAKQMLGEFIGKINAELEAYFQNELNNSFGDTKEIQKLYQTIWQHIKEHNLHPAKRLRSSFVFFGYKLLGGKNEEAITFASMSVELIHTALLMHDDVMDQDPVRRGFPTTHEYFKRFHNSKNYISNADHWGESMAIDIGDIGLFAGSEILMRANFATRLKIKASEKLFRALMETGIGQAYDMTIEAKRLASQKDIIALHRAKTGIYTYENPLHLGAILAGGHDRDLNILSQYAIPGGIAFQLQDDILGLFGDEQKTGKPSHSDLRQGKVTLLIIKALEMGSAEQIKKLKAIWGKKDLTDKDANQARKIIKETGSLDYSVNLSREQARKAQEVIPQMARKGWDKKAIAYLDGIVQYMVEREI